MTSNYWRNREKHHIAKQVKNDAVIARRIQSKYQDALDEIQKEIEAFYGRYADKEGISMDEARKRVSKLDIKKYERKAKKYVKWAHSKDAKKREKAFTPKAMDEMRIYNATMRISRLQLLMLNINLELLIAASGEERIIEDELTKQARKEYERQSGILGESLNYNERNIRSIVNASFLSATWSDRLWSNQTALRSELDKLLNRGVVQGKNPKKLARELRDTFNTSVYNSERLLRTEMARVQQDVFQDSMNQADIEQYEYIAEPTACEICKPLDGEIFNVKDMEPGKNILMHPNCRCSSAAYIDHDAWDDDLRKRGL